MARILIAEDETSVREFVGRALQVDDHVVTMVEDGAKALGALENETFDLLLADIRMPVLDGVSLALKVSKEHPALPILLMTGYAKELQRAKNLDALIHGVLQKPFSLQQICDAAAEAISAATAGRPKTV